MLGAGMRKGPGSVGTKFICVAHVPRGGTQPDPELWPSAGRRVEHRVLERPLRTSVCWCLLQFHSAIVADWPCRICTPFFSSPVPPILLVDEGW